MATKTALAAGAAALALAYLAKARRKESPADDALFETLRADAAALLAEEPAAARAVTQFSRRYTLDEHREAISMRQFAITPST